jgi:quinol monooxygenase YgiN
MIVIAGTIPVKQEKRDEAARVAAEVARATRREEGCLSYCFYSSVENPGTFLVFEEWESEDALARHFQTPHMKIFMEKIPALVAGAASIRKYQIASVGPM